MYLNKLSRDYYSIHYTKLLSLIAALIISYYGTMILCGTA